MAAKAIALCNQKGGVGKSTTTFQLARAAVVAGSRVLVVDNDPQGNITSVATQRDVPSDQAGLADVLSARAPESLSDVIVPGVWESLDVVPTTGTTLGAVRDELVIAGAGRERRLAEALATITERYDLVLIDCAPSLDQLTINALAAADAAVVVSHPKLWSLNGLDQLLETIDGVRAYYNPRLTVAGILVNQVEDRTVSAQTWLTELRQAAAHRTYSGGRLALLEPAIPKRVVISDATEAARGVDQWGTPEAKALARSYARLLTAIEGAF